jgi:hypothetical protein
MQQFQHHVKVVRIKNAFDGGIKQIQEINYIFAPIILFVQQKKHTHTELRATANYNS